jgi:hypothetical protein
MDNRQPKKVEDIEANIKGALTSRAVAEKALEEPKLNPGAKPFVPSTNKGGRSHRRKTSKKKTSKRRKYHKHS